MKRNLAILALAAFSSLPATAGVIALDNPVGAGNQTFGGSVGLDFNTGLEPLEITHFGAFDSDQDGFATARTVQIYDRNNTASPYATVTIPAGTAATLINGSRFWPAASTVTLPAGFQGSIVVSDVSVDAIRNPGVGPSALSTINNGGGLLRFVGSGRFGGVGIYPGTPDGGPVNRYQAGTFQFMATTGNPKYLAYDVAPSLTGGQDFSGPIGMDFDVGGSAVSMTHIGVFDSAQDGLNTPITAYLYDRDTQGLFAGPFTFTGTGDPLVNGSRLRDIPDVMLPAGFHGTIVADGYGAGELLYNSGGVPSAVGSTLGNGNGLISFVGNGRYGSGGAGTFPDQIDGGPANRYAAGTFAFQAMVPEPSSAALALAAAGLVAGRRRRK